jgi:hypothetical protein
MQEMRGKLLVQMIPVIAWWALVGVLAAKLRLYPSVTNTGV